MLMTTRGWAIAWAVLCFFTIGSAWSLAYQIPGPFWRDIWVVGGFAGMVHWLGVAWRRWRQPHDAEVAL